MKVKTVKGKEVELASTLTLKDVQRITKRSHVAVWHWRRGSETRDPMPINEVLEGRARRVQVPTSKFLAWAKKNQVEIHCG